MALIQFVWVLTFVHRSVADNVKKKKKKKHIDTALPRFWKIIACYTASGPPWHAVTTVDVTRSLCNNDDSILFKSYWNLWDSFFFHYLELMTRSILNYWKVFSVFHPVTHFIFQSKNICASTPVIYTYLHRYRITGFYMGSTKKINRYR